MNGPAAAILLSSAIFVGGLGIAIKYFGHVELIAGYDPDTVTDEEGLASFVGTNALVVAGLLVVLAVLEYTQPADSAVTDAAWIGFLVVVFALTGWLIVGSRRFERGE
ncbi:hypothetical protein C483_02571 [Natrialba hulunbeirensis JCM 10989]|uniref:DUF3784 domain-containing protein n=1 Tax=Natrialba hulunbeirensis JCM 10989 TaxID=1227493 RepID=M0ABH1_9EURY|nr:DUF3784 domain-containing protein [Natrialba hulunbeirensis]ELY95212.1 hypothetical protein C483_02571 [Natrialba hulunbeirensis JCM 10989]